MSWAEVKMAVKSIQRGYAAVTNADVTITLPKAVDPTRCLVLLDGFCGMYAYTSTGSYTRYGNINDRDTSASSTYFTGLSDSAPYYSNASGVNTTFLYGQGYGAARKPYVKALTETQLTIGQSGEYSKGSNGTTVSYQVIEFFN